MSDFVFFSPGALSLRAQDFLRRHASRQPFDEGVVGDHLRKNIAEVYSRPNERIVALLAGVQARYGGLAYPSGFFDAEVVFTPMCEPEDALEQLEISYAIQTAGPARASLAADGTVFIGLDRHGVAEFAALDAVIECDSMFARAAEMAATMTSFLRSKTQVSVIADRIRADGTLGLREVAEACGAHTFWFTGRTMTIYICGAWSALRQAMPPRVTVWAVNDQGLDEAQRLIWG